MLEGVRFAELTSGECPMQSHRKLLSFQTINLGRDSARLDIGTDATADSPNIQPSRISTEIIRPLETIFYQK